jgi:ferric-dicitrate binding protein FerR (iron transport regulator)
MTGSSDEGGVRYQSRQSLNRAIADVRRFELAKAALQGLLAGRVVGGAYTPDSMALAAVLLADALLARLEGQTPEEGEGP